MITSVSRGRLYDGVSRLEDSCSLSVLHHPQADPVFDAATGIEELTLGNCQRTIRRLFALKHVYTVSTGLCLGAERLTYFTFESECFGNLVDANHGSFANFVQDVWKNGRRRCSGKTRRENMFQQRDDSECVCV